MQLIEVKDKILDNTKLLTSLQRELKTTREHKATAIAHYEKQLAITMIQLSNGVDMELDGNQISKPSVTNTKDIARGIVWQEKLDAETAEMAWKGILTSIEVCKTNLTAYMSILKHFEIV